MMKWNEFLGTMTWHTIRDISHEICDFLWK